METLGEMSGCLVQDQVENGPKVTENLLALKQRRQMIQTKHKGLFYLR